VGAIEHFASIEDATEGRQEEIYRRFFQLCHSLLPDAGRIYLQSMLVGERFPPLDRISLKAKRGSDEYIVAVMRKFYPGSLPPQGVEQLRQAAFPYFRIVSLNNGREDYIETMTQWGMRLRKLSWAKALAAARTVRFLFTDPDFRYKMQSLAGSYNQECFRRKILDHQRIVFERCEI
jgi:cyclopropane-fatty-acyl-phospholipid synthase